MISKDKNERNYIAFISYRHLIPDKTVAKLLHSKLEHYRVPKEYRIITGSDRLGYVFRDEEELPASSNLSGSIKQALDNTKFLIVVCTPKTKESMWVTREIDYFLEGHPRENVLAVLVEGTPDESFPPSILWAKNKDGSLEQVEPLAANLTDKNHHYRPGRLNREVFRLCAAMLGCPFDTLWQRERRYRQRRMSVILTAALIVVSCFLGVVLFQNSRIASKNRQIEADNIRIEEDNKKIEEKNRKIEESNRQISGQLDEIKNQNAEILMREGRLLLEKGDRAGAVNSAYEAVSEGPSDAAVAAGAEALLTEALGAYDVSGRFRAERVLSQDTDIVSMVISPDGSRVFTTDATGQIRCFDTGDSELVWTYKTGWETQIWDSEAMSNPCVLEKISDKTPDVLICHTYRHVCGIDVKDGSLLWAIDSDAPKQDQLYSDTVGDIYCAADPHGGRIVLMDADTKEGGLRLRLVDNVTGKVISSAAVPVDDKLSDEYMLSGTGMRIAMNNGAFLEDGSRFACVFTMEDKEDRYSETGAESYCIWDLETGDAINRGSDVITYPKYSPLIGISFAGDDELNVYRYEWKESGILAVHVKADKSIHKERVPQPVKNSLNSSDEEFKNRYLFLPGKQYTAVGVNDSWHVFKNSDNTGMSSRNEGCDIVSFFWEDDRGQRLGCLLENGGYASTGWGSEDEGGGHILTWGYGVSMGQLRRAAATGPIQYEDKDDKGHTITVNSTVLAAVRSTSASEIVIFKAFSDPGAVLCDFDLSGYLSGIREEMEAENGDGEEAESQAGDGSFKLKDDYFELLKSRGNRVIERLSADGRFSVIVSDKENSTSVFDTESGEMVYQDRVASCDENILVVNNDEAGRRLYIFDGYNIHCIDTDSFKALFVRDFCAAYLPEEGALIINAGDGESYYKVPIYSRDDLVESAKNNGT